MSKKEIILIGAASGIAAGDIGTQDGPSAIKNSIYKDGMAIWQNIIESDVNHTHDKYDIVSNWCHRLAKEIYGLVIHHKFFGVIGGDHSCAIGTWSGAQAALKDISDLGLIWFDAHLDSHTPQSSESGNIHGMPVATLLGFGDERLTKIMNSEAKLKPENLCFIGIRSYEHGEEDLIKKSGVKIFYIDEVKQKGLQNILAEAIEHVTKNAKFFGLSLDIDGLDPLDAPAVGTPVANGISAKELCEALIKLPKKEKCIGFEITEFNPHHDQDHKTEKVVWEMIRSIIGETHE